MGARDRQDIMEDRTVKQVKLTLTAKEAKDYYGGWEQLYVLSRKSFTELLTSLKHMLKQEMKRGEETIKQYRMDLMKDP